MNFPDPGLRDWRRAYYGPDYDRLVAVKRRYDPSGLLRFSAGRTSSRCAPAASS
ncbi:BBE domain-containing protein [Streptomyces acidiscabies]|uniref:BBE domain-containing protein n=1 Tax=Streptomyces acidiscabies TaxID=42234 RepID=UPI003BAF5771